MSKIVNEHATPEQHPDDAAVDRFAASMKAKLAKSRAKGRSGWEDKSLCSAEYLSELLRGHVDKGDPVDVGDFCMMLQQCGEGIAAAPAQDVAGLLEWAVDRWHAEVANRPLQNVHRRSLDDTWRQVIRKLGGDAGLLCGPAHDALAAHDKQSGEKKS